MKKTILLLITLTPSLVFSQCVSGDCQNGYGTYYFTGEWEGDTYIGEWKDGNMHGYGVYTWSDGNIYKGEHRDNLSHGFGSMYYLRPGKNQGDVFHGEYKDGKKNGIGTYIWSDGKGDVSYYIDGKEIKRLCDFEK
ncbi:MAG: hypothetical protein CMD15_05805 [Flavobacteriales bacterium]|nr:hypothetical protein [Flavobacteriales bacterium]|tara:strand:- start:303 stop:710 length:408 start_codon:yes stop_codon:yes gene_type:complete